MAGTHLDFLRPARQAARLAARILGALPLRLLCPRAGVDHVHLAGDMDVLGVGRDVVLGLGDVVHRAARWRGQRRRRAQRREHVLGQRLGHCAGRGGDGLAVGTGVLKDAAQLDK